MLFNSLSLIDLYLVSPGICLFLSSILILFIKILSKNKEPKKGITAGFAFGGVLSACLLSTSVFQSLGGKQFFAFNNVLIFSPFTYWVGMALLLGAVFSIVLFKKNKGIRGEQFSEFLFLFLSSVLGAFVILWSNNFLVLFIGIQLVALPLYIMILLGCLDASKKESVAKYYILDSVVSAFFLLGLVLVYGSLIGQFKDEVFFNIEGLLEVSLILMKTDYLFLIGSIFMLLSALFKLGVVPFHNWVLDICYQANTAVTYYMITVVKITAILFIFKLMSAGFLMENYFFQQTIQWIVVLSMLLGALFACSQESVKKIFVYSGLTQLSYMLMPLLGYSFDGKGSVDALVFYFFSYIFFLGLVFYILQKLEEQKGADVIVSDLIGLHQRWPKESLVLLLGILGLSGMPPLVGFITRVYIIKTSIETGFYWVSFWALLASAMSMVYYLKIINKIFIYDFNQQLHILWENRLVQKTFCIKGVLSLSILVGVSVISIYYFPLNS